VKKTTQKGALCTVFVTKYYSVTKSRKLKWARHVVRMGSEEVHTGIWWGNLREGGHMEDPGLDGRIILKQILEKWYRGA
jgi:hypothetical protein